MAFHMLLSGILVVNRVCCLVPMVQRHSCKVTIDKSFIVCFRLVLLAYSANMLLLATKSKIILADI